MSRSPAEKVTAEAAEGYLDAFEQVYRMHQRGRSFSGREPNSAFLNTADGRFADISGISGLAFPDDGRAIASTDWDQDGDLDLWIANRTSPRLRFLRNDSPRNRHFLTLRLVGAGANRDAIGARVEVLTRDEKALPGAPLVKSLRAGEGFLSQSSKWLHFGLGAAIEIDRVVVHWPAGAAETFRGVLADRRSLLRQGSGVAALTGVRRAVDLRSEEVPPAARELPERALLVSRPPLPRLDYRELDGRARSLVPRRQGPLLLNLWATWCLPCRLELRELTRRAAELQGDGVEVLALSVDGLDEGKGTSPAMVGPFLAELGFPFAAGLAGPELLAKLELLLEQLFSRRLPIAVPTSLLIDSHGRLAAIYRGPVDVAQLLRDARELAEPPEVRRNRATPIAGRWFGAPQQIRLVTIARRFLDEGLLEDAALFLEESVALEPDDAMARIWLGDVRLRQERVAEAERAYREAVRLAPELPAAWRSLANCLVLRRAPGEAVSAYQRAIDLAPENATTRYTLGLALQDLGRFEEAGGRFREALGIDPLLVEATAALGTLLAFQGKANEAIPLLERALAIRPDQSRAHNTLGVLLFDRGDVEAAIGHFRRALALDPETPDVRDNLAQALRQLRRELSADGGH